MQQLLIIGFVFPEPKSSAAGTRMITLIHLFRERGWKITFASASADSEFMFDVTSIGVEKVNIKLNDSTFDDFVKTLNPDVVLFDRFNSEEQFGWRVAENCPNALRILDTEDLHFLRLARQQAWKESREFSEADLYSETAKREIASILRCDLSLIISEFEMELLTQKFKIDRSILFYLPFLTEGISLEIIADWSKFEERSDFIFIGNFLHEPNWNSVQYLKETIWPKIRMQLPETSLKIYGAYPSQKVLELHKPSEGFLVMGRAENAMDVVKNARIVLAPIRFGAGAKGKLLEAMLCGTPSITTMIGAESMSGNLAWSGIIVDDADEIAKAAVELYNNKTEWKIAQQNGVAIVNERFCKKDFVEVFLDLISIIRNDIANHRRKNFISSILQHQMLSATKYMSRWIEEKNKN